MRLGVGQGWEVNYWPRGFPRRLNSSEIESVGLSQKEHRFEGFGQREFGLGDILTG